MNENFIKYNIRKLNERLMKKIENLTNINFDKHIIIIFQTFILFFQQNYFSPEKK